MVVADIVFPNLVWTGVCVWWRRWSEVVEVSLVEGWRRGLRLGNRGRKESKGRASVAKGR